MNAEEIRKKVYATFSGTKKLTLKIGDEVFEFILKKRTEADFSEMVSALEAIYSGAMADYMSNPGLLASAKSKWGFLSEDQLVETVARMTEADRRAMGMDLFDDLHSDDDESLSDEERAKLREDRLREWLYKQKEEIRTRSRDDLLETLATKDAEIYARLQQVKLRSQIIVSQCVYGEDDKKVFPTAEDVARLPRTGLNDALKQEVSDFLITESAPVTREVVEAADFCGPTESEKPST